MITFDNIYSSCDVDQQVHRQIAQVGHLPDLVTVNNVPVQ